MTAVKIWVFRNSQ